MCGYASVVAYGYNIEGMQPHMYSTLVFLESRHAMLPWFPIIKTPTVGCSIFRGMHIYY